MDSAGLLGIIPPLLAIGLALKTKDVIFSMFSAIFVGAMILAHGNPILALANIGDLIADKISDSWNIRIFLFCALLGGFVGLLTRAGAAKAFGSWASKFIKGRKSAQLWTWLIGLLMFIDDYFNAMSVGSVMRPVAEKNLVSKAKSAYIVHTTATAVCVLVPISSWVVAILSYVRDSSGFDQLNINEMNFFLNLIPYNIYALLALLMIPVVAISNKDFGPMKKSEELAKKGQLFNEELYGLASGNLEQDSNASGAKWFDMLLPIIFLVTSCLGAFAYTGFKENPQFTLADAFRNADASHALLYGVMITLAFTYVYFLLRRVLAIKNASESIIDGINSMVPALAILSLAWTIGHIISSPVSLGGLGLPIYLDTIIGQAKIPLGIVPFSVFIISCLIAFSIGTSWGTFGIMIPITMPLTIALAQSHGYDPQEVLQATLMSVGAVLSGAVFGDNASPISDTTILASASTGAPVLEHIATQLPYAIFLAFCSSVGLLVGGFTLNPLAALSSALFTFVLLFFILANKKSKTEI